MELDSELYRLAATVKIEDVVEWDLGCKGHPNGKHLEWLCPFHDDKDLGSFRVTPSTSLYSCFSCGPSGRGGISYLEKRRRCSRAQATLDILSEFKLIAQNQIDELYQELALGKIVDTKPRYTSKRLVQLNNIADCETLQLVYRCFISAARSLLPVVAGVAHFDHPWYKALQEKRNLQPYQLVNFFPFPESSVTFWSRFRNSLASHGLQESVLLNIPGFYYDALYRRIEFSGVKNGTGLIGRDADGRVQTIQVRKAVEKGKYVSFSSAYADGSKDASKGTRIASHIDFVRVAPGSRVYPSIAITEGKFKALRLADMGINTLNMYGVSNWREAADAIPEMKRAAKLPEHCAIYLFFDADISTNDSVAKSARGLAQHLSKMGYRVVFAVWPIELGKGVDDLYNEDHFSEIKKVSAQVFIDEVLTPLIAVADENREALRAARCSVE